MILDLMNSIYRLIIIYSTPEQHSGQMLFPHAWNFIKTKNPRKLVLSRVLEEYPGRESNPHGRNDHRILSPACLPVPPPGRKVSLSVVFECGKTHSLSN